jgi:Lrp/AsnC family transcriptional regulator for asnA, asnC and gidA
MAVGTDLPAGAAQRESAPVLEAIDERLLASLTRNGRAGFAELGKELGLSRDAVRVRLRRLQNNSIVTVTGTPDPKALGYRSAALVGVTVSGSVRETAQRLAAAPEVSFVASTFGGYDTFVEILGRDDEHLLELIDQRIRSLPSVLSCTVMLYLDVLKWTSNGRSPLQSFGIAASPALDDGDRALIRALQLDGRASFRDLAETTGLSYSNARRKTRALLESGAVRVITTVNRLASREAQIAAVGVTTSAPARAVAEALAEIEEVEVLIQTAGPIDLVLEVACIDREHLASLVSDRIRGTPGVVSTETFVYVQILRLPVQWGSDALNGAISTRS